MYEILVPTILPKTTGSLEGNPCRKRHHRIWDAYVRKLTGGLTIFTPAKGQWVHQGVKYEERMIPVKIAASPSQMSVIAQFTKKHYRQLAVCYYKVSDEVHII